MGCLVAPRRLMCVCECVCPPRDRPQSNENDTDLSVYNIRKNRCHMFYTTSILLLLLIELCTKPNGNNINVYLCAQLPISIKNTKYITHFSRFDAFKTIYNIFHIYSLWRLTRHDSRRCRL